MKEERQPPLRLQQEEALARRLSKSSPLLPKIHSSIEGRKAGYRGEKAMDYHLTFLPPNKYLILRGPHLIDQYSFQIDTLLLSPNLIILIETKNFAGEIFFDKDSNQMIQKNDSIEKGYDNPLEQVKRQTYQLKNVLSKFKFPFIPTEHYVTFSNPKTILKTNDPQLFKRIFHAEHFIKNLAIAEKRYPNSVTDDKMIRKIYRTLAKESKKTKSKGVLEIWEVSEEEVIRGVECPGCQRIPMTRLHHTWFCPSCKLISKDAHVAAIKDYFLLIGPTITNKQCREFLHIPSRRTAERILQSMGLNKIGTTKGTYYMEKK